MLHDRSELVIDGGLPSALKPPPIGTAMTQRKSIFITGAASGIGRHTALLFASRGWFVELGRYRYRGAG